MNKIFFAAASLLALGEFGCAAPTSSSDAESTSEAVHRAQVVGEFQHCGGYVYNAPVCGSGLKCQLDATRPDTGGICVKKGVGARCGGNIVDPPTCTAGLECVLDPTKPDVGGTCQYASYDESCGGFIADPIECGPGLACSHVDADGNTILADKPGVCLEGAGSQCGGNIVGAKVCAEGLTCQGGTRVGDVGGTCQ